MEEDIKDLFLSNLNNSDVKMLNPLVLAFVGDAFFSFYVKSRKIDLVKNKVKSLNKLSSDIVNAHSQREMYFKIVDLLDEEERSIVMRARNTNIHSHAKNFSIEEYRHATAFEALLGYLYLTNNFCRINYLLNICFK